MKFIFTKLQLRLIRKKREFRYIDSVGLISNTLIESIPGTELRRPTGQYTDLVVQNEKINFESNISKTEVNFTFNLKIELYDKDFNKMKHSVFDLISQLIRLYKELDIIKNDSIQSKIFVLEGFFDNINEEDYTDFLIDSLKNNTIIENVFDLSEMSFTWKDASGQERHISFNNTIESEKPDLRRKKVSYAFQEYNGVLLDSDIAMGIDKMFEDFEIGIFKKLKKVGYGYKELKS